MCERIISSDLFLEINNSIFIFCIEIQVPINAKKITDNIFLW